MSPVKTSRKAGGLTGSSPQIPNYTSEQFCWEPHSSATWHRHCGLHRWGSTLDIRTSAFASLRMRPLWESKRRYVLAFAFAPLWISKAENNQIIHTQFGREIGNTGFWFFLLGDSSYGKSLWRWRCISKLATNYQK